MFRSVIYLSEMLIRKNVGISKIYKIKFAFSSLAGNFWDMAWPKRGPVGDLEINQSARGLKVGGTKVLRFWRCAKLELRQHSPRKNQKTHTGPRTLFVY